MRLLDRISTYSLIFISFASTQSPQDSSYSSALTIQCVLLQGLDGGVDALIFPGKVDSYLDRYEDLLVADCYEVIAMLKRNGRVTTMQQVCLETQVWAGYRADCLS